MKWPADAATWPHHEASRFVESRPHGWHVQEMGDGPLILLIHGAGGATQSWRGVMPELARTHRVVAVDLPGQGFTRMGTRSRSGLDPLAEDLARLAEAEGWEPAAIVGHSAGAAIALRLWQAGLSPRGRVIGINPALAHFEGVAGWLFPAMAKTIALNPFAPGVIAATSTRAGIGRLLAATGSDLDDEGRALYYRLGSDPAHVDGTITMMSQWNLARLIDDLPRIEAPTTFLVGDRDVAVPPRVAHEAAERLPNAEVVSLGPLGHLAHEEDPGRVAGIIRDLAG